MTAPAKGAIRGVTLLRSSLLSGVVTVADLLPGGSPPPLAAPTNNILPSISGSAVQGDTLTLTQGSWSGNPVPSVSDLWMRNGVSTGQTGLTYTLTLADVGATITVQETATNSQGNLAKTSNAIGPISGTQTAPSNTAAPSISGTAQVGSTLTAVAGTWSGNPTPTVTGSWRRNGTAISGATALTYVLVSADQGATIDYYETATNSQGTAYQASNSLGPVTAASGGGTLSAPVLGYPTAANPPTLPISVGPDWQTGNTLKLQIDTDLAFTTPAPTILTHVLTDADTIPGATITLTIPTLTGVNYFRALGNDGADSVNLSNIVAWGDSVAPTISTAAAQSVVETLALSVALAANEAIAKWEIVGGADQLQFQIVGTTLEWVGNGSKSHGSPVDQNMDNVYNVIVRAHDYGGNYSDLSLAVTVTAADMTPTPAFAFTDVSNAALSTLETSNTITLQGVDAVNISAQVQAPGEYSLNGGAWTPAGSFTMQLTDTLAVRATSSSAYSTDVNVVVTIGTQSDTYTISTMANPSAASFTASATQPADIPGSGGTVTFGAADFIVGTPIVYTKPVGSGRVANTVTLVGAGAAGADITFTKIVGSSSGDNVGFWVGNADVAAAGNYQVKVVYSAGTGTSGVMTGTLTHSTSPTTAPTSALVPVANITTYPANATPALTIPTNGVGIAFVNTSSTSGKSTQAPASIIKYDAGGGSFIIRNITAGSWTPNFTTGTGYGSILAAAFGP